jgi:hypothetical protein
MPKQWQEQPVRRTHHLRLRACSMCASNATLCWRSHTPQLLARGSSCHRTGDTHHHARATSTHTSTAAACPTTLHTPLPTHASTSARGDTAGAASWGPRQGWVRNSRAHQLHAQARTRWQHQAWHRVLGRAAIRCVGGNMLRWRPHRMESSTGQQAVQQSQDTARAASWQRQAPARPRRLSFLACSRDQKRTTIQLGQWRRPPRTHTHPAPSCKSVCADSF